MNDTARDAGGGSTMAMPIAPRRVDSLHLPSRLRGGSIWRDRGSHRRDRGSMAIEVVILVPILFTLVLLIVAGGRLVLRQGEIDSAARDAARAASLARSSGEAQGAASSAVSASMGAISCPTAVDTSTFAAGGSVTVQISCVIPFGDLGLVGLPGSTTVRGTSVAPLDQFRRTGTP